MTTNWDNNRNQNYTVTVSNGSGGVESLWVGNVAHAPPNGYILPTNHLVVSCESWPIGAATNVALVYSADGGATWQAAAFSKTGTAHNNDLWSLDLQFPHRYGDRIDLQQLETDLQPARTQPHDHSGGNRLAHQSIEHVVPDVHHHPIRFRRRRGSDHRAPLLNDSTSWDRRKERFRHTVIVI